MGKPIQKICPHCKKEFTAYHPNKKYCSSSHRMMAYHKRKGYKIIQVQAEEKETTSDKQDQQLATQKDQAGMKKPVPNIAGRNLKETAIDAGIYTGSSMLANWATERLKPEPNRAATKQDIYDIHLRLDYIVQALQKDSSSNENNKGNNFINTNSI